MTKIYTLKNPVILLLWILLISYFFAEVEIQIEGNHGWASSLPTWRVEHHPLLDIFWGGRPMTGYHAWVFSFMFLIFHLPVFIRGQWSIQIELRIIGSLMMFWIIEDFLWFVLNPDYGLDKFSREFIPWHKKWLLGVPLDYITFTFAGILSLGLSYKNESGQ
jgi:hypothetical protein